MEKSKTGECCTVSMDYPKVSYTSGTVPPKVYPNPRYPSHPSVLYGTSGHLGTNLGLCLYHMYRSFGTPRDYPRPSYRQYNLIPGVNPIPMYCMGLQDTLHGLYQAILQTVYPNPRCPSHPSVLYSIYSIPSLNCTDHFLFFSHRWAYLSKL